MPTVTLATTIEEPINARFSSNASVTFGRFPEAAVRDGRGSFVAGRIDRTLTLVSGHVSYGMQGKSRFPKRASNCILRQLPFNKS
jgi:hypothetical protein